MKRIRVSTEEEVLGILTIIYRDYLLDRIECCTGRDLQPLELLAATYVMENKARLLALLPEATYEYITDVDDNLFWAWVSPQEPRLSRYPWPTYSSESGRMMSPQAPSSLGDTSEIKS